MLEILGDIWHPGLTVLSSTVCWARKPFTTMLWQTSFFHTTQTIRLYYIVCIVYSTIILCRVRVTRAFPVCARPTCTVLARLCIGVDGERRRCWGKAAFVCDQAGRGAYIIILSEKLKGARRWFERKHQTPRRARYVISPSLWHARPFVRWFAP